MASRRPVPDADGMAAVATARAAHAAGDPPERAVQRAAVKYTLQLLAARAPGASVEVRIPPLGAVQAVAGPVHRRGTPSAVVEMDPPTWLALAVGELAWEEARSGGRIRASGERADLSPWLPLVALG